MDYHYGYCCIKPNSGLAYSVFVCVLKMELTTPVNKLPSVGPVYAKRLVRMNINTLGDLLYHFPFRYDDFRLNSKIAQVQVGETVTLRGKIIEIKNEYLKNRKVIQKAVIEDNTGNIDIVWFNQPFLTRTLHVGDIVSLSGKIDAFSKKLRLESPVYEKLTNRNSTVHTGRLVPIYPETSIVSSKWLRNRIAQLLPLAELEEFLPNEILTTHNLPDLKTAFNNIHFPQELSESDASRQRFAFEELFLLQLGVLQRKHQWQNTKLCWPIKIPEQELSEFIVKLPFELTHSQKTSLSEVLHDLRGSTPMNRLLEGDVGSGKTVIASAAAFVVAKNKLQTAIMAPTQILASQHYNTLQQLLEPHGISVQLITGGQRNSKSKTLNPKQYQNPKLINSKLAVNCKLETGNFDVIVGTHALIQKTVKFEKLAFVVIDEQHKFGVEQRAAISAKTQTGCTPHTLAMTATPIPRTIALTLYGDLDLSVINELPPGRQKITTWVVPPFKRDGAYNWISQQIQTGSQVFIVCPLIEESEHESMKQVKAASAEFNRLKTDVFPELKLGLLHGRLKQQEKDQEIEKFRKRETDILISTPVVEVGIDIPNATIMVVEAAERFGLAQLHQLRGRVGRGEKKSYCLIFTSQTNPQAFNRLKALEEKKSGAELAELDLRLRGPGEVFGIRQHGFEELRVASFSDFALIKQTHDAAEGIFSNLDKHPRLKAKIEASQVVPN